MKCIQKQKNEIHDVNWWQDSANKFALDRGYLRKSTIIICGMSLWTNKVRRFYRWWCSNTCNWKNLQSHSWVTNFWRIKEGKIDKTVSSFTRPTGRSSIRSPRPQTRACAQPCISPGKCQQLKWTVFSGFELLFAENVWNLLGTVTKKKVNSLVSE